jgi:putative hydrolase of the HAD superfamily
MRGDYRLWLKAILFDIDDTLFDRQAAQLICLHQLTAHFGWLSAAGNREILLNAWLESDRLSIIEFNEGSFDRESRSRHFLRLLGLPLDYTQETARYFWQIFPLVNAPVPGARDLITGLSRKCLLGIISNSYPDIQYKKIDTLGLSSYFSCILLSEELGLRKPDPAIFHMAADRLAVSTSECLYVGDSFAVDMLGARKSGMLACWFNRAILAAPPQAEFMPDFSIRCLDHLCPLLQQQCLIK